jgi:putative ABC transport system permease protein
MILETFVRDLRWALRMAWRTPGVTLAATLALALGIGASTAMFSVVDGVLLRPLPFPEAQALHRVYMGVASRDRYRDPLSYPQYQDLVTHNRAFESLGGWTDDDANLTGGDRPERVLVRFALPSLLPTLKVQPARGRNFLAEETIAGKDRVVLISHALWQRQFEGREDVLGKSVRLDGVDHQVVGVLPRGFQFEGTIDLWAPLATTAPGLQVRNSHFLSVVGRLRPGATPATITGDLQRLAQLQTEADPKMFPAAFGLGFRGPSYLDALVGDVRLPLLVLLGAVGFVLITTCANIASLLLARAAAREREMAIRTALGAGRGRLVRQLLTESLLLAIAGGALGVLFARWGIDGLLALSPESLPRMTEVALDLRVLVFTGAIAVGSGLAFGLAPALAGSRPALHDTLKEGMFGSTSRGGRLRKALVVAQVAVSLVLLVGAGLMLRSFVRLRAVDPGFRPDHALTFRVSRPDPNVPVPRAAPSADFFTRLTARLRQLPGVTAAGACNAVPLDGIRRGRLIEVEGYVPRDSADMPSAQNRQATPGWFASLGIPVVAGRAIEDSDVAGSPGVVVVNQSFVRRFFPGGDALGKRIRLGKLTDEFPWATIVGVVGDVRGYGLEQPARSEMYWPLTQVGKTELAVVVRTGGDPRALAGSVRAVMAELDPAQPIHGLQTVEQLVASSFAQRTFTLTLMVVFGVVALALAAIGLYGIMAFTVAQRTREIGIRLALGAPPARVLGMVMKNGMTLVAAGTALGTIGALIATRVVASLLYGTSRTDPVTYLAIAATLAAVALVAMLLPARHAMRVDPVRALRAE